MKTDCVLEHITDITDVLKAHNEQGRGVFFVVNHGGHEDGDIDRINAHFCEMDDIPLEEQLKRVWDFPLEPSLIVKTRKSLHCYCLMENADIQRFRIVQKKLIAQFGADPACVNESRVFRLPGYYHCKEEPLLVECIKFNPEKRYTQEQLEAVLPEFPDEHTPGRPGAPGGPVEPMRDRGKQKGLVLVGRNCAYTALQEERKDAQGAGLVRHDHKPRRL